MQRAERVSWINSVAFFGVRKLHSVLPALCRYNHCDLSSTALYCERNAAGPLVIGKKMTGGIVNCSMLDGELRRTKSIPLNVVSHESRE